MRGAVHIIERDLIRDRTVAGLDAARAAAAWVHGPGP